MNYTKGNWTIQDKNKYETSHIECGIYRICRIADNREYKANARLIAAAPDMYEALKALCEWLDTDDIRPNGMYITINEAKQALNKAEGK